MLCIQPLRSVGSLTHTVSDLPATTFSDSMAMAAHVSSRWLANVSVTGRSRSPLRRGPLAGRCEFVGRRSKTGLDGGVRARVRLRERYMRPTEAVVGTMIVSRAQCVGLA